MKLNHSLFDESISLSGATFLAIEDRAMFSRLVKEFYQYNGEGALKIFDRKFCSVKESEIVLITDILGYPINSNSVLKLVHLDLLNQLNEKPEVKLEIEKLMATLAEFIAFECVENELDLEYGDWNILDLLKTLNLKIETKSDTIFEKCFEIVQVFKYLSKNKLFVFVNTCAYFTRQELQSLVEYIELNNMVVLFLEPLKIFDFPQYILDEDYILLTENMI